MKKTIFLLLASITFASGNLEFSDGRMKILTPDGANVMQLWRSNSQTFIDWTIPGGDNTLFLTGGPVDLALKGMKNVGPLSEVESLSGDDLDISAGTGDYTSTGTITAGDITVDSIDANDITVSDITETHVVFAGVGGLLTGDAGLIYIAAADALTVAGSVSATVFMEIGDAADGTWLTDSSAIGTDYLNIASTGPVRLALQGVQPALSFVNPTPGINERHARIFFDDSGRLRVLALNDNQTTKSVFVEMSTSSGIVNFPAPVTMESTLIVTGQAAFLGGVLTDIIGPESGNDNLLTLTTTALTVDGGVVANTYTNGISVSPTRNGIYQMQSAEGDLIPAGFEAGYNSECAFDINDATASTLQTAGGFLNTPTGTFDNSAVLKQYGLFGAVAGTVINNGFNIPDFIGLSFSVANVEDFIGKVGPGSYSFNTAGCSIDSTFGADAKSVTLKAVLTNCAGDFNGIMKGTFDSTLTTSKNIGAKITTTDSLLDASTGSLTSYGLYIDACAGVTKGGGGVLTSWGLYEANGIQSAHAGNFHIGGLTAPTESLVVTGNADISGSITAGDLIANINGIRTVTPEYGAGLGVTVYGDDTAIKSGTGWYDHDGGAFPQLFTGDAFAQSDADNAYWILFLSGEHIGAICEIKEYISATTVVVDGMGWDQDINSAISEGAYIVIEHPSFITGDGYRHEFSVDGDGDFEIVGYDFIGSKVAEIEFNAAADDPIGLFIKAEADGYNTVLGQEILYESGALGAGEVGACSSVIIDDAGANAASQIAAYVCQNTGGPAIKDGLVVLPGFTEAVRVLGAPVIDPGFGYEVSGGGVTEADRVNGAAGDGNAFLEAGNDLEIFDADDDYILIGSASTFAIVQVTLATGASRSITPTFFYSKAGGNWTTLPIQGDNTNGFQNSGSIVFDPPVDWTKDDESFDGTAITDAYYIAVQRTFAGTIVTLPTEDYFKTVADQDAGMTIRGDGIVKLPYLGALPANPENGMIWTEADGLHMWVGGAEVTVP